MNLTVQNLETEIYKLSIAKMSLKGDDEMKRPLLFKE
jgi:hypothetical protein